MINGKNIKKANEAIKISKSLKIVLLTSFIIIYANL